MFMVIGKNQDIKAVTRYSFIVSQSPNIEGIEISKNRSIGSRYK